MDEESCHFKVTIDPDYFRIRISRELPLQEVSKLLLDIVRYDRRVAELERDAARSDALKTAQPKHLERLTRRTRAEVDQVVKDFCESRLSRAQFCRANGIRLSVLSKWLRRAEEGEKKGHLKKRAAPSRADHQLQAQIERVLRDGAHLGRGELCQALHCDPKPLMKVLRTLVREGRVIRTGKKRGTKYHWNSRPKLKLAKAD